MAPPPPPQDRVWTSPKDPIPLSPTQAQNHAAHFLHKWSGHGEPFASQYGLPRVLKNSTVGWTYPQWFTQTRYPSPFACEPDRGLWYRVQILPLANNDLARIALRDTCTYLKQ